MLCFKYFGQLGPFAQDEQARFQSVITEREGESEAKLEHLEGELQKAVVQIQQCEKQVCPQDNAPVVACSFLSNKTACLHRS